MDLSAMQIENGNAFPELGWFGIVCVLALVSALYVARYYDQRRELLRLKGAVRKLTRLNPAPTRLGFRSPDMAELWRLVTTLANRGRSVDRQRSAFQEVIQLSSRITGAMDQVSNTADEVARILHKKTGPDVVAIGVVVRDGETGEATLESVYGLPATRIGDPLLMLFDILFEQNTEDDESDWGYLLPHSRREFDFSFLGVGLSLTVPLRDTSHICGGLWLGFREGAVGLTPQRKAFVQSIAEHAAASFYAAKKVEAKQQQSDSERDFLLGLSHDLRAPGNSALYALRDLISGEAGPVTPEQHVRLSVIEQALEDQLGIVSDVLDYAKHQKGFLQAKPERVDLAKHVLKTINGFNLTAARKNLTLVSAIPPEASLQVDPHHLTRILSNFLSNAIKYTDTGTIHVDYEEIGEFMELTVTDTGIGIPVEEQRALFTEFQRFQNASSRQGFGLGLALTKVLAELNGGYVFYRPHPAGGSTFGVGIKIFHAGGVTTDVEGLQIASVLVVDDDPATCRMNSRYLRDIAQRVIPAQSVDDAIALASEFQPELIITDLALGAHSAEELLAELERRGQLPAVIIITGSGDAEALQRIEGHYGAVILEKPAGREVLCEAVRKVAGRHSQQRVANL